MQSLALVWILIWHAVGLESYYKKAGLDEFLPLDSFDLLICTTRSFQDLLRKQEGDRVMWEYPFAVAGVNITFMLIQMLDLEAAKPQMPVGATFLKFLAENEIAFKLMDHQWLAIQASYMDFNTVMKAKRRQLEMELLQENITLLEELPSYARPSQSIAQSRSLLDASLLHRSN